jgi:hypothetical protein
LEVAASLTDCAQKEMEAKQKREKFAAYQKARRHAIKAGTWQVKARAGKSAADA